MADWKRLLHRVADELDDQFDARRVHVPGHDPDSPAEVICYRSFGTSRALSVRGRLMTRKLIVPGDQPEALWRNVLSMVRRLDTDELPHAPLHAAFQSNLAAGKTDDEGYFDLAVALSSPAAAGWHEVSVTHSISPVAGAPPRTIESMAPVLVPPEDAQFGVISDLDDTVVKTNVHDLSEMVRTVVLQGAAQRLPFDGVTGFYQALQNGSGGARNNPIFYLSGGPWNLYDLYADFLDLQKIPRGPILLGDFGLDDKKLLRLHHSDHKLVHIRTILTSYPEKKFVLIGDSGEHDPEIYAEAAREFPGRIIAIYIRRSVAAFSDQRRQQVEALCAGTGAAVIFAETTEEMERDAASRGLILNR